MLRRIVQTTETYRYRVWGFGESIAMQALLAMDSPPAESLICNWAHTAPPLAGEPLAHVAPGVPLLHLYARTRDRVLLERSLELAEVLASTHVGSHGARIHRPDLAGWEHEVWVDCMHLDGPFLAELANISGDLRWRELSIDVLLSHARVLQDERTGLFSHGFDDLSGAANGVFWGRGQGWAMLGLLDTLLALPADHTEIHQRFTALVDALAGCESDCGGRWHTVVDVPETYLETSVSAFVALGVGRAVDAGIFPSGYAPLAQRALAATRAAIDADGGLQNVSDATPVGSDADHYARRPVGVFPWGQGPALLALAREVR